MILAETASAVKNERMKKIVVLTGAGISAESGLSTFRDAGGLWDNYPVEQVATPEGWARDPALVTRFYNNLRRQLLSVRPSRAHELLARLEQHYDVTVVTQNVDDLLQSHTARTMLANSEFLLMLNQASTDRIELARLLNISDNQLSYISGVDFGHGLLKCGSTIVPFVDHFPKNGKLYQLMTTKLSERVEQAS